MCASDNEALYAAERAKKGYGRIGAELGADFFQPRGAAGPAAPVGSRVAERLGRVHLDEVHVGGGTPTYLTPAQLDRLLGGVLCMALDARLARKAPDRPLFSRTV